MLCISRGCWGQGQGTCGSFLYFLLNFAMNINLLLKNKVYQLKQRTGKKNGVGGVELRFSCISSSNISTNKFFSWWDISGWRMSWTLYRIKRGHSLSNVGIARWLENEVSQSRESRVDWEKGTQGEQWHRKQDPRGQKISLSGLESHCLI